MNMKLNDSSGALAKSLLSSDTVKILNIRLSCTRNVFKLSRDSAKYAHKIRGDVLSEMARTWEDLIPSRVLNL